MLLDPDAFRGAVLYEPPVVTGQTLGGEATVRARRALDAGRPGRAMAIFAADAVGVPGWVARLGSLFVMANGRMRQLIPRQISDVAALDALGNRLAAYAAITRPVLLLGGAKSPVHLGRRLDELQRVLPHATRELLANDGHGANARHPRELAEVIARFAAGVTGD